MKIENKVYDNHTTFGELECGDVFIHDGEVCMKTNGDVSISNAVSLEDGLMMCFLEDDEVRLVKATLTIE
jgi:hypothetical protein